MAEKYPVIPIEIQRAMRDQGIPELFVKRSTVGKLIISADDTKIYDAQRGMIVCPSPDGDLPSWEQRFTPPDGMEPAYLVFHEKSKEVQIELRPKRYVS